MTRADALHGAPALFLLFELDGERYALDAAAIDAVLPLATAKAVPGAPAWVAGLLMRDGAPVPVVDVPMLALGRPAHALRSTRLVMVRYRVRDCANDADAGERMLGLIVERATQTMRIERGAFRASGVATPRTRWLGPVASTPDGIVQQVSVRDIVDSVACLRLFDDASANGGAST
ncbi:chemotaxis protein CheW [Burkholderia ubonensis]|uniref:chemotaxis protein CheW n=1 Tax=Burkholderia ubonensis TaxID=101571 RepID=UPI00075D9B9D|nr:chemotaxis protein CheW [Burkholderia ubonensis]KVO73266.1 chemotaxis protein CheW [Burkholderia ubonensis]KWB66227.1 chemotaxis protein CheW [Burkholderia ubonensis]KWB69963.1 chemotaxis protein CheW [Burkholderia ubonensis]KWE91790.1 chemotaxis protein CheW [Burkholderia ubonensis]OJA30660.1 chemotaxis protein CheW [Burkholderia ubonensis]